MRQPCRLCPFKKSSNFMLMRSRAEEIVEAISHDSPFHCHDTLDYDVDGFVTFDSKLCFGAALFLEKSIDGGCLSNLSFRFAAMRKQFEVSDLREDDDIYSSKEEFIDSVGDY